MELSEVGSCETPCRKPTDHEVEINHPTGCSDVVAIDLKDGPGIGDKVSSSNYQSLINRFCSINQFTDANSVKEISFVTAEDSDGMSSVEKTIGSARLSDLHTDFIDGETSSIGRDSIDNDISDESSCSNFSNGKNKPHKANDSNWEAIGTVRSRDGVLGLTHFRLLKRLGYGDIGSVYLAQLCGIKSYFSMKVVNKGALESWKKLPRAQTEKERLKYLDHPFLPTLYAHFETEKFSCLVMEF